MKVMVELDVDWNDEFIGDEATEMMEHMLLGSFTTWKDSEDIERIVEISDVIEVTVLGD